MNQTILQQINDLDSKISHYERELMRLEAEYKTAQKQKQDAIHELQEKGYPVTIEELRELFAQTKQEMELEVQRIQEELDALDNGEEVVKTLDEVDLPF